MSVNLAWLRQFAASILDKVESVLNRSDILTKGGVEPEAFADHTRAIGVVDASEAAATVDAWCVGSTFC